MNMYYVYILKCRDGSYYTGVTNDIERRIEEHNSGEIAGYTSTRKPVELIFSQSFNNVNDAIRAEKQIKGWTRVKKEALINNDFKLLSLLSKSHASTGSA